MIVAILSSQSLSSLHIKGFDDFLGDKATSVMQLVIS